jgi:tetraacyldisaccharide 4'-kinase
VLSTLYAAVARRRRERYAARPDLRRRLRRPVISVGNLAVGGRGKTPLVAAIARELLAMGERPAILSRGYGRTDPVDGVVVVRDPDGIRSDLGRAGDEPLMLARQLEGASVLVCPDRYLAGCLAEHHLAATVHVLDDGFQHLQLERDIDILIVGREDIARPVTLPGGRLREPLDTFIAADAIVAADHDVRIEMGELEIPLFRVTRGIGAPAGFGQSADRRLTSEKRVTGRPESETGGSDLLVPPATVVAVAGIASPVRFFDDLRSAGYALAERMAFADHHPYSRADVRRIFERAAAAGAAAVLTTEKDFVRLLPHRPFPTRVGWVPLTMEPDPLPDFRRWLADAVNAARDMLPNPEFRVPNPESRVPSPGPRIPNSESRVPNPESRVPSPGSRVPGPVPRTPESRA